MSEDTGLHVGDISALIEGTIKDATGAAEDISGATVKKFEFFEPSAADAVVKTAEFSTDGTDGKLKYTTEEDFLDQEGTWSVRAYLEFGSGWKGRTGRDTFEVYSAGR